MPELWVKLKNKDFIREVKKRQGWNREINKFCKHCSLEISRCFETKIDVCDFFTTAGQKDTSILSKTKFWLNAKTNELLFDAFRSHSFLRFLYETRNNIQSSLNYKNYMNCLDVSDGWENVGVCLYMNCRYYEDINPLSQKIWMSTEQSFNYRYLLQPICKVC